MWEKMKMWNQVKKISNETHSLYVPSKDQQIKYKSKWKKENQWWRHSQAD